LDDCLKNRALFYFGDTLTDHLLIEGLSFTSGQIIPWISVISCQFRGSLVKLRRFA
jgi:hypothetical protein